MAARLGARVAMIGCLGDDDLGEATMANLAAHGVDATGVARVAGTSSGVAPIWVDADRDQPHPHRARRQRRGDGGPRRARPRWAICRCRRRPAGDAAGRDVGGLRVGPAGRGAHDPQPGTRGGRRAVGPGADRLARRQRVRVPHLARRRPGAGDGERGRPDVGLRCGRHPRPRRRARRHRRTSAPVAVAAPAVDAVDTTGAGDAFVGTFAVAVASRTTPVSAVRLGCAAGALAVQRPGTQTSFPTPRSWTRSVRVTPDRLERVAVAPGLSRRRHRSRRWRRRGRRRSSVRGARWPPCRRGRPPASPGGRRSRGRR